MKSGLSKLNNVSFIIFDEAHRARGNYAYVGIATYHFRQCCNPLVLLDSLAGWKRRKIAEVCGNLGITAIEHRTTRQIYQPELGKIRNYKSSLNY